MGILKLVIGEISGVGDECIPHWKISFGFKMFIRFMDFGIENISFLADELKFYGQF